MYFLIYLSTATEILSDQTLFDILKSSRRNNSANNITGILLYYEGAIIQAIEGEKKVVADLFERLLEDPRHHSVMKIMEGESDSRYFDEWTMGFRKCNAEDWQSVQGYLPVSGREISLKEGDKNHQDMINFLRSFYRASFR